MMYHRENSKLIVGIANMPYELLIDRGLTAREKEILGSITLLDKVIAYKFNISVRTVVNHSVSLRRKTGCKSKAELAQYATILKMVN